MNFYTWDVRQFIFKLICFDLFHNLIFWVLGLEIEHNGILLITDFSGRPLGEAYVQFTNVGDGKGALQKHKESMGHRLVGHFNRAKHLESVLAVSAEVEQNRARVGASLVDIFCIPAGTLRYSAPAWTRQGELSSR